MSGRRSRRPPSLDLIFSSREPTPPPCSDNDTDDENMESTSSSSSSCSQRPISSAMTQAPFCLRRPTLAEILSNQAPPPYTLSAFMAYLSQNHCLETLEFTMDASRYRKHFNSLNPTNGGQMAPDSDSCQYVRMLWQRLLDAYIAPNGPREVNLPCGIRESLLNIPNQQTPPPPESLDPAVNIIYELMEESVLLPFLNSCSFQVYASPWESHSSDDLYGRGSLDERIPHRKKNSRSPPPLPQEMSQSYSSTSSSSRPRTISPFGWPHRGAHFSNSGEPSSANASGDSLVTEDSLVSTNTSASPMTPPSTPPNSDSPLSGSPKFAKAAEKSWKRKLGWGKKDDRL